MRKCLSHASAFCLTELDSLILVLLKLRILIIHFFISATSGDTNSTETIANLIYINVFAVEAHRQFVSLISVGTFIHSYVVLDWHHA